MLFHWGWNLQLAQVLQVPLVLLYYHLVEVVYFPGWSSPAERVYQGFHLLPLLPEWKRQVLSHRQVLWELPRRLALSHPGVVPYFRQPLRLLVEHKVYKASSGLRW